LFAGVRLLEFQCAGFLPHVNSAAAAAAAATVAAAEERTRDVTRYILRKHRRRRYTNPQGETILLPSGSPYTLQRRFLSSL